MNLVASCAFGLEAIVARELQALGCETTITGSGQVEFAGDWEDVCRTNLWLRTADRVSIILADFPCLDFDVLFDTVRRLDWPSHLAADSGIHVTGSSVASQLTSVPAIQRTVKKAIVESMLRHRKITSLPEDGAIVRVHIGLRNNQARLSMDTTGASLHKRGYREIATKAPLKETLAAALVQLSFWQPGRSLIDPFCGGGTIAIEAAMIGRNLAPGLHRSFACEAWPQQRPELWAAIRSDALSKSTAQLPERLLGTDIHAGALSIARRNAAAAGVEGDVHFQQRAFQDLSTKRPYGCLVTNPPYGDRLDGDQLRDLYESIPLVLAKLPTWSHFILTAYPNFEQLVGRQADRRRKLYNGRIECTYFQFHGPKPGTQKEATRESDVRPVFGGSDAKTAEQAEIFRNRLRNRARHLRRWPRRGITCYRLYERDVPEIPLVVDRYEDYLHIVEFERPHARDLAAHAVWLERMATTAAETLEISPDNVLLKSRQRQRRLQQHEKVADQRRELVVREGGLRFLVNLSDFVDTGLFLDHRIGRGMVREMSPSKRFLNLFGYTGTFSVYAAAGGAAEVTTVDWSHTYLEWAQRNFALNQLRASDHQFIREDARQYVRSLPCEPLFDLIVCDPPTFSNSKRTDEIWEVQRDHGELLSQLLKRLAPEGTIFFSCNFRRFKLDETSLHGASIREISKQTVPEDFRNKRIHRSWLITHAT